VRSGRVTCDHPLTAEVGLRALKTALDPRVILNFGKVFDTTPADPRLRNTAPQRGEQTMAEPQFKEVTALAVDAGTSSGASARFPPVEGNTLCVQTGSRTIPIPELWRELAPDRGVHVLHEGALLANMRAFQELFSSAFRQKTTVAWAVKSFAVPAAANALATLGGGADTGSLQELRIALDAGIDPRGIVCTAGAKEDAELEAIVACGATSIVDTLDDAEALETFASRAASGPHRPPHQPGDRRADPRHGGDRRDRPEVRRADRQALAFVDRLARQAPEPRHMHLAPTLPDRSGEPGQCDQPRGELVRSLRRVAGISRVDLGGGFRFPYLSPRQAEQMGLTGERFHLVTQPDVLARSISTLAQRVSTLDGDLEVVTEPGTAIVAGANFTLGKVLGVREVGSITSRIDGGQVPAG
jgi:diaminopimelate decarboxylase